jgi:hypothetical protein
LKKTKSSISNRLFERGSVCVLLLLGSMVAEASTITLNAVNSGWYRQDGSSNGFLSNIAITNDGTYNLRNWLGFDLSSVSSPITSATLEVSSHDQNDSGQLIVWSDVVTSYASLGSSSRSIYNDLGSGVQFSSGVHTAGTINSFSLNAAGLTSLNSATSLWAIGGKHNDSGNAFAFTLGVISGDHLNLVLEVSDTPSVPLPASVWLFCSGLVGLVGVARRRLN